MKYASARSYKPDREVFSLIPEKALHNAVARSVRQPMEIIARLVEKRSNNMCLEKMLMSGHILSSCRPGYYNRGRYYSAKCVASC